MLHGCSYSFYSDFFKTWIVREISLETVKNLLPKINEDVEINLLNCSYHFRKKDYKKSLEFANNVLRFAPNHSEALLIAAKCYKRLGKIDLAYDYFKRAIAHYQSEIPQEYIEILEQKVSKAIVENKDLDHWLDKFWEFDNTRYADLRTLKHIETELNITLERIEKVGNDSRGFVLNQNGQVTGLSLYNCKIENLKRIISHLKNLTNLTELYLKWNQLSDISHLKDLKNLTKLGLESNKLSDISPLIGLKNLTELSFFRNQIHNIFPLRDLKNLTKLGLSRNQISDISHLRDLKDLM